MRPKLPEERAASVLRSVERVGGQRRDAMRMVAEKTRELRPLVLAALDAGVTTRRVAEVAQVSLATIADWKKEQEGATTRE